MSHEHQWLEAIVCALPRVQQTVFIDDLKVELFMPGEERLIRACDA
jgi:hypothetical protein